MSCPACSSGGYLNCFHLTLPAEVVSSATAVLLLFASTLWWKSHFLCQVKSYKKLLTHATLCITSIYINKIYFIKIFDLKIEWDHQ